MYGAYMSIATGEPALDRARLDAGRLVPRIRRCFATALTLACWSQSIASASNSAVN